MNDAVPKVCMASLFHTTEIKAAFTQERLRLCTVCVFKKVFIHMHSFHLMCLFTRDRWTRCSTYAGTVSGAVTSATKYTKSSEEDPRAMLPWLPFCLCPAVDLATCSKARQGKFIYIAPFNTR